MPSTSDYRYGDAMAAACSVMTSTCSPGLERGFGNVQHQASIPVQGEYQVVNNYNNCTFNYGDKGECMAELERNMKQMSEEQSKEILEKIAELSKQNDTEFKKGLVALVTGLAVQSLAPHVVEAAKPVVKNAMEEIVNDKESGFLKRQLARVLGNFVEKQDEE